MEQDPDVENSSSRAQKLLWFEDVPWFDGDAPPYGGVAEKGGRNGRKSGLVMGYVWQQLKSNIFKPFHWLLLFIGNHSLCCSPAQTKVGTQHPRGPKMKL